MAEVVFMVIYRSAPFSMTLNDPLTHISRSRQCSNDAFVSASMTCRPTCWYRDYINVINCLWPL